MGMVVVTFYQKMESSIPKESRTYNGFLTQPKMAATNWYKIYKNNQTLKAIITVNGNYEDFMYFDSCKVDGYTYRIYDSSKTGFNKVRFEVGI